MSDGMIIISCSVAYILGVLGAIQTSGHFMRDMEGAEAFWLFGLRVLLWPVAMPVAGLAWLFGAKSCE